MFQKGRTHPTQGSIPNPNYLESHCRRLPTRKEGEVDEVVEMVGGLAGNVAHVIPLGAPLDKQARCVRMLVCANSI